MSALTDDNSIDVSSDDDIVAAVVPSDANEQPEEDPQELAHEDGRSGSGHNRSIHTFRRILLIISSLAVPFLILSCVVFPVIVVVMTVLVLCFLPTLVILGVSMLLYLSGPSEALRICPLFWCFSRDNNRGRRSEEIGDSAVSSSRRTLEWTLFDNNSHYHGDISLHQARLSRRREELEELLLVKTVVLDDCHSDKDNMTDENCVDMHGQQEQTESSKPNDPNEHLEFKLEGDNIKEDIETGQILIASTTFPFSQIANSVCDICMSDYKVNDVIAQSRNANCQHIFHKDCILDWMQMKHSCPRCRRNFLGED